MDWSKQRLSRRALLTVLVGGSGGAALVAGTTGVVPLSADAAPARGDVTLYKNPQCGCCEGYADYLRDNGFKVKAISTNDLTVMGQKYGIADDLQPCHISLIGGYVVGGHIPIEVIDQPRPLPEIRFQDEQGHDLTLADFRGRVVLLNIWATWCAPCRNETPTLDRLQAHFGGKDFLVIPLSIDREGVAAVRRFYEKLGFEKLGIYVDPSSKRSRALAIPGLPATLLIDRQGRETARKIGAAEWGGAEMVSLVERTIHAIGQR